MRKFFKKWGFTFLVTSITVSIFTIIMYLDKRNSDKKKDTSLFNLFMVKDMSLHSSGIFIYKIESASESFGNTISFTSDKRYSVGDTLKIDLYDRND